MHTLTPAYGRDYKSAKAVKEDYLTGKDFIYNNITSPYHGKMCSYRDFPGETVTLRYNALRRVTTARSPE
jgi:hypothetical protein